MRWTWCALLVAAGCDGSAPPPPAGDEDARVEEDGGGEPDPDAGPIDLEVDCQPYEFQINYPDGDVTVTTQWQALVDVGGMEADFRVITCGYWYAVPPTCPVGSTCSASPPTSTWPLLACYASEGSGSFAEDGRLIVHCGTVIESTPSGGATTVTDNRYDSVRVLR